MLVWWIRDALPVLGEYLSRADAYGGGGEVTAKSSLSSLQVLVPVARISDWSLVFVSVPVLPFEKFFDQSSVLARIVESVCSAR